METKILVPLIRGDYPAVKVSDSGDPQILLAVPRGTWLEELVAMAIDDDPECNGGEF